jgi:branched-chain amino acid transport system permease protein
MSSAPSLPGARALVLLGLLAVALVVSVSLPSWGDDYQLLVGYQIAQLAALAQAWNIMAGYGGLVSLAVSAFVGIGSYATTKLSLAAGLALVPSIVAGGVFAVLFAVLVAVPMFRFRGLYFTIGSLVLAQALAIFMLNYNGLGGNGGLTLVDVAPTASALYLLALACGLLATIGAVLIIRGRLGLGLMAVRDDEDVAERVGVATFRVKLVSFVLSAFVMGLIGGLQAQKLGHIEPSGSFTLSWTIDSVNAAIIGGVGTILGPLLGALVVKSLGEAARLVTGDAPGLDLVIYGAVLVLVVWFAPRGLMGLVADVRAMFTRRAPAPASEAANG